MFRELEKFTKKQKIIALIILVIFIILTIVGVITRTQQNNTLIEETPETVVSAPVVPEKPNDLTADDGTVVEFDKYPNPDFPALNLTDVIGSNRLVNPPVQNNGQPRTYLDCGRLITDDPALSKIVKKACVNRKVEDGKVVSLGSNETDYIFYLGKARDEYTITLVKDIGVQYVKAYLIYEYDFHTQSSNYIDKITLTDPTKYLGDKYVYATCPFDKVETYSDPKCQTDQGDFGTAGNLYYFKVKDRYFRDVNLP